MPKRHDSTGYNTEPPNHLAAAVSPEVQALPDVDRFGLAEQMLAHLTPVVSITRTGVFAMVSQLMRAIPGTLHALKQFDGNVALSILRASVLR